ncbi:YhbY family RNA-binding protein [Candidatus Woesearchaeota archaeon]|nr:YhbY family RNA-binding protein [Candidatus Woesearchaeota archaeon]
MVLTKDEIKKLKQKANALEPLVRIGKNGLTESVVAQIKKLVTKRKIVKIKFLRSFLDSNDKKAAAKDLANSTDSEIVEQVGFVVVLYKR